jgi:hypothetical protein
VRIDRAQFGAAEQDLHEAEAVCREHGLRLQLALVQDNLGRLHALRGDVPTALRYYDESYEGHLAVGAPALTVLMGQCELLLSVPLVDEGRQAAQRAVDACEELNRRIYLPEAYLLLADAALLDRDLEAARDAADRALRVASAQRRSEWSALARYAVLKCHTAAGADALRPAKVRALVESLEAAGQAAQALDARLRAGVLALEHGRLPVARAILADAGKARWHGPADIRVRAWHAEALLRLADGERRSAEVALRRGVQVLEEHQASLGATELRAHSAWHRADLVALGTRLALERQRPRAVLAWAERGRAIAALTAPVQPSGDEVLEQALTELRATVADAADAMSGRGEARHASRRQVALERAIRQRVRQRPGRDTARVRHPSVEELSAALCDSVLVEFVESDGVLHAVTLADGRTQLHHLGDAEQAYRPLPHIPFALRRLHRPGSAAGHAAAIDLLASVGKRLDMALLAPLGHRLRDRPVVIVPTGPLQWLPWSLLPSCLGRPVSVAPSATLWHRATTSPHEQQGVVAVAGPDLPHAPDEARAIAGLYAGAELLVGAGATAAAVKSALARTDIAHVAAHGVFRGDNPLFSCLRLADGALTVYELESLPAVPRVVVLAACNTAQSAAVSGDELLGIATTFLTLGCAALVASVVPLPDGPAVPIMCALHTRLRAGTPVAEALAQTQLDAAADPDLMPAATGLLCLGAGQAGALRLG